MVCTLRRRSRLWSAYRESFDSNRNYGAGSQIFWSRSELQSSFRSELHSGFANLLIQIGTVKTYSELFDLDWDFRADSWIILFRSGFRITFHRVSISNECEDMICSSKLYLKHLSLGSFHFFFSCIATISLCLQFKCLFYYSCHNSKCV